MREDPVFNRELAVMSVDPLQAIWSQYVGEKFDFMSTNPRYSKHGLIISTSAGAEADDVYYDRHCDSKRPMMWGVIWFILKKIVDPNLKVLMLHTPAWFGPREDIEGFIAYLIPSSLTDLGFDLMLGDKAFSALLRLMQNNERNISHIRLTHLTEKQAELLIETLPKIEIALELTLLPEDIQLSQNLRERLEDAVRENPMLKMNPAPASPPRSKVYLPSKQGGALTRKEVDSAMQCDVSDEAMAKFYQDINETSCFNKRNRRPF